jgi:hypothetical protein
MNLLNIAELETELDVLSMRKDANDSIYIADLLKAIGGDVAQHAKLGAQDLIEGKLQMITTLDNGNNVEAVEKLRKENHWLEQLVRYLSV